MVDKETTTHITLEELAYYFGTSLPEERESVIEEHLAECGQCTGLARQIHTLSFAWNRWTARTHGEAYQRVVLTQHDPAVPIEVAVEHGPADLRTVLAGALETMREHVENPDWQRRLESWRGARRAEAAVRLIMEAPGKAPRIVTEGLEALLYPEGGWRFALASWPVGARGVRARGTAPSREMDRSQVRAAVSDKSGEVMVYVDKLPLGQHLPLILLIPTRTWGEPKVKLLERQDRGGYLASFEGVEPGDYLVAFEPLERAST